MVFPRQAYHKVLVVTKILMKPPLSGRRKGQSMEKLSNPQVTIETIKKYEFAFQKKFGQNFLIDAHVINKIISAADITKDDCVLEIGPGIGTMTQYLAESAGQVVAVEIDKNLLPILDETLAEYDNVTIINDDILKVDINKIVEERNGGRPIKVVANLPYYITTPIIMGLFEKHVPLLSVTVMVQKEVAERICAAPGTSAYSAFSIYVQYHAKAEILFDVPADCFVPRPKVDSAVLKLTPLAQPAVETRDEKLFFALVRAAFNMRRKTLVNALGPVLASAMSKEEIVSLVEAAGLDARIRGERLSLADYAKLADLASEKLNKG